MPRFQPEEMLRVLERHPSSVRSDWWSSLAATLHGSPLRTGDADICPARDRANLERLAAALAELQARISAPDAPAGLAFPCDAEFLSRVELLNLVTRFGDLDISFQPAGSSGYAALRDRAVDYDLEGLVVPVAALADIIHSKEAAGRAKDLAALPTLRTLLEASESRGKIDPEQE